MLLLELFTDTELTESANKYKVPKCGDTPPWDLEFIMKNLFSSCRYDFTKGQ